MKKVIVVMLLGLMLVPGCHRIARKLGLSKHPAPAAVTSPRP